MACKGLTGLLFLKTVMYPVLQQVKFSLAMLQNMAYTMSEEVHCKTSVQIHLVTVSSDVEC